MTTETTGELTASIAQTAAQTVLQMSPEIISALAAADPQAGAIAAIAVVATQIIQSAVSDFASGAITSAQLVQKFQNVAASMNATHSAWAAFAASQGVPETETINTTTPTLTASEPASG